MSVGLLVCPYVLPGIASAWHGLCLLRDSVEFIMDDYQGDGCATGCAHGLSPLLLDPGSQGRT